MGRYTLNLVQKLYRRIFPFVFRKRVKDICRLVKRYVFLLILWIVKQYTIIKAYLVGYYRYAFFFKVGHVYVNNYNSVYYKYTGDGIFREGNKIIDSGYIALEVPGNNVVFNIFGMGVLRLGRIQKLFSVDLENI